MNRLARNALLVLGLLVACSQSEGPSGPERPRNHAPVADAGEDVKLGLPGEARLDGGGSGDPDGDALDYAWSLLERPAGSSADLMEEGTVSPRLECDEVGEYVCELMVDDSVLQSEPDTVIVELCPTPSVTPVVSTIGSGLQVRGWSTLGTDDHDGVTVRIESDDPTRALVAAATNEPGDSFVDLFVPPGETVLEFIVQGVPQTTGSVQISASAPGFESQSDVVQVVRPALLLTGVERDLSVGIGEVANILIGIPNGSGALASLQGVSAANLPQLQLLVESGDGMVLEIEHEGMREEALTIPLEPGEFQLQFTVHPIGVGVADLSVSIPGFTTLPEGGLSINVDGPQIRPFSRTIGAGLQYTSRAGLDIADHGGVTVRIESAAPGVALIAPDPMTAGHAFLERFVPDGEDRIEYTVQGVVDARGSVMISGSAPGFATASALVEIVQPAIIFSSLATSQQVGVDDAFVALVGPRNSAGTGVSGYQGMSAANEPPLVLTVSSSQPIVGIVSGFGMSGAEIGIEMTAGMFQPTIVFQPQAEGNTIVSAAIPGFLTGASATVEIAVTP